MKGNGNGNGNGGTGAFGIGTRGKPEKGDPVSSANRREKKNRGKGEILTPNRYSSPKPLTLVEPES